MHTHDKRHERDDEQPVPVNLGFNSPDAAPRRRLRSAITTEIKSLHGPRDDLRHHDEPDRARRLHTVLDFAGEAELLRQLHGDGLDALEHDRQPDHTGNQDGGEGRLGPRHPAGGPNALTNLREHVEEHEAPGGTAGPRVRTVNSILCFQRDTTMSRRSERPQRRPAGGGRRTGRRRARPDGCPVLRTSPAEGSQMSWPPSVAQLLSGQPDEDGLERGLGHGQVGQREPAGFGRLDHPRDQAIRAAHLEFDAVGEGARPRDALEPALEDRGQLIGSPAALTVTMVSAPTLRLSSLGVSRARILPWSMMATRLQSLSASSM